MPCRIQPIRKPMLTYNIRWDIVEGRKSILQPSQYDTRLSSPNVDIRRRRQWKSMEQKRCGFCFSPPSSPRSTAFRFSSDSSHNFFRPTSVKASSCFSNTAKMMASTIPYSVNNNSNRALSVANRHVLVDPPQRRWESSVAAHSSSSKMRKGTKPSPIKATSSRHMKHRPNYNQRVPHHLLKRNKRNHRMSHHPHKNQHPRNHYEKVPFSADAPVTMPRNVNTPRYGGNVRSVQTAAANIPRGSLSTPYFVSNRVMSQPKFLPPPPPASSNNVIVAPKRKFLPPTSFVGLVQRTLNESINSVEKTNKGYDCITTSQKKDKVDDSSNRSNETTNNLSSSSSSLISSSSSSSSERTDETSSSCRLEYDPRQPQYSPSYDPDPFYNDREYSPLFPQWYD